MLCQFCTDLDLVTLEFCTTNVHVLLESASKGCEGCNIFLKAYRRDFRTLLSTYGIPFSVHAEDPVSSLAKSLPDAAMELSKDRWRNAVYLYFPRITIQAEYDLPGVKLRSRWCSASGAESVLMTEKDQTFQYPLARPVASNSSDNWCLGLAKHWLEQCPLLHGGSCTLPVDTPLPSRLIQVPTGVSEPLRLCDTKIKRGQYVALSYCWGKGNTFQTTTSTLQDRFTGFSIDLLPRTLRDAVQITRRMGFRWLWVDALCIIQGDAEDWNRESALMADVYGNAAFTIAADLASDTDHGIFAPRNFLTSHKFGKEKDFYLQIPDCLWYDDETSAPLYRRGWALQERILSPRILHFYNDHMIWECNTNVYWEDRFEEHGHGWDIDRVQDEYMQFVQNVPDKPSKSELEARIEVWNEIADKSSLLDFTVETDKLPSLSSLATRLEIPALGRYLAGVWEYNPFLSMCWKPNHTQPLLSDRIYQAPSWSWASVKGRFYRFHSPNVGWVASSRSDDWDKWFAKFQPKLLDALIIPSGSDPKGRVMEGSHLTINGCCRYIYVGQKYEHVQNLPADLDGVWMDHGNQVPWIASFEEDIDKASELFDRKEAKRYTCLQISKPIDHPSPMRVIALILQPVDGEEGAFTRVGLCHFDPDAHGDGWERKVLKLY